MENITDKVRKKLESVYKELDELIDLIGLEYTDDDEYVCHNTDQEWCDYEMLESIENGWQDIGYFLGKR